MKIQVFCFTKQKTKLCQASNLNFNWLNHWLCVCSTIYPNKIKFKVAIWIKLECLAIILWLRLLKKKTQIIKIKMDPFFDLEDQLHTPATRFQQQRFAERRRRTGRVARLAQPVGEEEEDTRDLISWFFFILANLFIGHIITRIYWR